MRASENGSVRRWKGADIVNRESGWLLKVLYAYGARRLGARINRHAHTATNHAENSTKLRQLRVEVSSSRKSMKFASGESSESSVLRRLVSRLRRLFSFGGIVLVARTGLGTTTSSSSSSTLRSFFSSSSSSSSLMLMKLRGRSTDMRRRRLGERPSSAASAAERLRVRVLTDATERNEGEILSAHAGALDGSASETESPVSGGVGGIDVVGENVRYDRASPGDRIGEERSGGERTAGSECVARWPDGLDMLAATSGKHAEKVRVRFDGR